MVSAEVTALHKDHPDEPDIPEIDADGSYRAHLRQKVLYVNPDERGYGRRGVLGRVRR